MESTAGPAAIGATGATGPAGAVTPYGITNQTRANTDRWRAARGKVQANVANGRILCVGNSITAGYNSTGVAVTNPASLSYPTQLAQILTNDFRLNASWQSWCGGQNIADFNFQDNRIVMGSWANSGLGTFGGNALTLSAAGTLMSFTPTIPVDTVEVLALRNSTNVRITIAVDGGATLNTYNPFAAGSGAIGTSGPIALGTLASHAIQANVSAAQASFLSGMIAYNSAAKEISVLRAGWQGATAASFNTSPWFYTDGIKVVAPDLTLIAATRNDATNVTNVTAYKASLQSVIDAAIISGDVIMVIEPMGNVAPAAYAAYTQAVYDLATLNSLPVIDFTILWDVYANVSSWYTDTTHPAGFGYADMARQIANVLMAM